MQGRTGPCGEQRDDQDLPLSCMTISLDEPTSGMPMFPRKLEPAPAPAGRVGTLSEGGQDEKFGPLFVLGNPVLSSGHSSNTDSFKIMSTKQYSSPAQSPQATLRIEKGMRNQKMPRPHIS
jgi:hypothetical protein